jgi:hypothetical protein
MSTTAAAITIRDHTLGATTSVDAVAGALAVVWCRSVGTSWTLELYEPGGGGALGTITDWIPSGVPISQPQPPEALARELLAQRGLVLFGDSSAGPCTHNRRGVGYVYPNR